MANWNKIGSRGNVSDRRGSPLAIGGGMGIVGVGAVLLFTYLTGGDVLGTFMNMASEGQLGALTTEDTTQYEGEDSYETFVSTVLGSTDEYWDNEFGGAGETYTPPELVLFRGGTQSACGGASSMVGPHYCPIDSKIYLDETFFNELETRLGAEGGDVAEAYVIAHEVGHHVQNELGLLGGNETNQASVATELQADCLAGAWLGSLKNEGILEDGEIREALDAASTVGDDNIQKRIQGEVQPESWTHGSSEQRIASFDRGYNGTGIESCIE
jgi:uncharacterized protein